jgi:HAD superfamily hydrolase (TIGR01548 family)
MKPRALLLDLDGVLADVSRSYRAAITETARSFGAEVTHDHVAAAKQGGGASNDWELTRRLLQERGVRITLDRATRRFQSLYLGTQDAPGFREHETLIPDVGLLRRLASRLPLAIVTGRPRAEAEWFLDHVGIRELFSAMVCMEDAPAKPSPEPVGLALQELGASSAWMIGDTPDDMQSARTAGVVPIGIVAPADDPAATEACLRSAGAASVIRTLDKLEEMLP